MTSVGQLGSVVAHKMQGESTSHRKPGGVAAAPAALWVVPPCASRVALVEVPQLGRADVLGPFRGLPDLGQNPQAFLLPVPLGSSLDPLKP